MHCWKHGEIGDVSYDRVSNTGMFRHGHKRQAYGEISGLLQARIDPPTCFSGSIAEAGGVYKYFNAKQETLTPKVMSFPNADHEATVLV